MDCRSVGSKSLSPSSSSRSKGNIRLHPLAARVSLEALADILAVHLLLNHIHHTFSRLVGFVLAISGFHIGRLRLLRFVMLHISGSNAGYKLMLVKPANG